MKISDRFRGDTDDLVFYLKYRDTNGDLQPITLITDGSSVVFSYRKGSRTKQIVGEQMTDLGEVHFPFAVDAVVAGTYEYDIQVTNGITGKVKTFVKDVMIIKDDVTK